MRSAHENYSEYHPKMLTKRWLPGWIYCSNLQGGEEDFTLAEGPPPDLALTCIWPDLHYCLATVLVGKSHFASGNRFLEYFSHFFLNLCGVILGMLSIFPYSSTKLKWGLTSILFFPRFSSNWILSIFLDFPVNFIQFKVFFQTDYQTEVRTFFKVPPIFLRISGIFSGFFVFFPPVLFQIFKACFRIFQNFYTIHIFKKKLTFRVFFRILSIFSGYALKKCPGI